MENTIRMIAGCIISLLAVLLGLYVSFTARGKGPVFSNTYFWLNKEERKKADKKAEYKLVTIIFSSLAIAFACMAVTIFTGWVIPRVLMWLAFVFAAVYAVMDTIRTENGKKK